MCVKTCPPSWHNLADIFEHGSTEYLKIINSHSTESTIFSDLNIHVLKLILISLPLYISARSHVKYQGKHGLRKSVSKNTFVVIDCILMPSVHLGPKPERLNWKHNHVVDAHIVLSECPSLLPPLRDFCWDSMLSQTVSISQPSIRYTLGQRHKRFKARLHNSFGFVLRFEFFNHY